METPGRTRALRMLAWLVGAGAFALVAIRAHLGDAIPVIGTAGPALALLLAPYLVQIGLDALAWRVLLGGLGHRPAWRRLVHVRLATEAVLLTVPGGSFVGESLKPYLLASHDPAIPLPHAVASVGIKRALLAIAQAGYVALALALGAGALAAASPGVTGTDQLPRAVAVVAIALLVVGLGLAFGFARGRVASRTRGALARLPSRRLRAALDRRRAGFATADAAFATLGARRRRLALATALLLAAWLVEAGETWLGCRLVGIELDPAHALAMEACVVFARNLAVVVPAGLGVQDAGYLGFLAAFGAAPSLAAAFVIAKRCKEVIWVGVGYALMFRPAPPRALVGAAGVMP